MKEKNVVVFIKDNLYAERFVNYCNSDRNSGIRAVSFTEKESFKDFLDSTGAEIILCDEETAEEADLTGSFRILSEEPPGRGKLSKYTSAQRLLEELRGTEESAGYGAEGRITGFISLFDDGRSEEMCLKAAAECAGRMEKGRNCGENKVLYVSFSPFCEYIQKEEQQTERPKEEAYGGLSRLLFELSGGGTELSASVIKKQGMDLLYGPAHLQDADEIGPGQVSGLMKLLKASPYDHIFVDIGPLHGYSWAVAEGCDTLAAAGIGNEKEARRLDIYLDMLERSGCGVIAKRVREAFECVRTSTIC